MPKTNARYEVHDPSCEIALGRTPQNTVDVQVVAW